MALKAEKEEVKSKVFLEVLRLLLTLPVEDRESTLRAAMVFFDVKADAR
jgi:hypothetical protein